MGGATSGPPPVAGGSGTGASAAEDPYRFGDLLALARRSWLRRLSARTAAHGFGDVRRSDPLALRILARGAQPIGRIGDGLGISRQGARKLVDGLVARGYARTASDPDDARRRLVALTERGLAYHRVLSDAAEAFNAEVRQLPAPDLAAADRVLRAVLTGDDRRLADAALPPPAAGGDAG